MLVQALWKTVSSYLLKFNVYLLYDPAISFLGVYPRKMKMYVYKKTCTQISIVVFITVQN